MCRHKKHRNSELAEQDDVFVHKLLIFMSSKYRQPEHTFHIPVMGIAFTIDSPIKVARFGISSVISIVEDRLIEMMRQHYYSSIHQLYEPITTSEPDYRAKRITDYLNLVNTIVQQQMQKLRSEAFERGSDIVKYFEMLPEDSRLKAIYNAMMQTVDVVERRKHEMYLKSQLSPGSIDVNIMTKVDRNHVDKSGNVIPDASDAVSALRGYALSELENSSVVFSAGMNPRLYNYLESLHAFDPDENYQFSKKVIVKVSDYRSALIQGKYLAKKGIWVSEFRIESGLNCGGHAFATDGFLLGPIMEEFKTKYDELRDTIFAIYKGAINKKLDIDFSDPPEVRITVQGGIGTHEEDQLLKNKYNVASTGWGTPFLLVPEATTVDAHTLNLLSAAGENDIELSHNSPLGVRFHYLKGTTADIEKKQRIANGKAGSPCTEKHLALNTEFTEEPICTASLRYQKLKMTQLKGMNLTKNELDKQINDLQAKECLCIGLSNSAAITYDELFVNKFNAVNICPGPNIANFSEIVSLQTMTDHIYGRTNIMHNAHRPNLFVAEIILYINYLKEQLINETESSMDTKRTLYYRTFITNLYKGLVYYTELNESDMHHDIKFTNALLQAEKELTRIELEFFPESSDVLQLV